MHNIFLVMAGGAIGAGLRYQAGRACQHLLGVTSWPWGTFIVNIVGGLCMGLLVGLLAVRSDGSEPLRLFIAVGILGGFTTFSAFSLETLLMIERGDWFMAISYALLSVIVSIGALALGLTSMRTIA